MPQSGQQALAQSEQPVPPGMPPAKKPDFNRLVSLFPNAKRGYVSLRVRSSKGPESSWEKTSLWYGTPDTVILLSNLSTHFGETLVLRHPTMLGDFHGTVIGLLDCESGVGVALRFIGKPPNWILK